MHGVPSWGIDDLLAVANTRHGPRAHAYAEGDTGRDHDHLSDGVEAREFLAPRVADVPAAPPSARDLQALRRIRDATHDHVEHGAAFPQDRVKPLVRSMTFRLGDDGRFVSTQDGWRAMAGHLLVALAELSRSDVPVKRCRNADCRWLFRDRSRNHSRQWCEMGVCGNRAKVSRFKRRRRATSAA